MERDFDTIEEFYSILVTNIYSSECDRPLRANHNGKALLSASLSQDEKYFDEFKVEIKRFVSEMPVLCDDLARVKARFNPLRTAMKTH